MLAPLSSDDYPQGDPAFLSLWPADDIQLIVGVSCETAALRLILQKKTPTAARPAANDAVAEGSVTAAAVTAGAVKARGMGSAMESATHLERARCIRKTSTVTLAEWYRRLTARERNATDR